MNFLVDGQVEHGYTLRYISDGRARGIDSQQEPQQPFALVMASETMRNSPVGVLIARFMWRLTLNYP